MKQIPATLGDRLSFTASQKIQQHLRFFLRHALYVFAVTTCIAIGFCLLFWWYFIRPNIDPSFILASLTAIAILTIFLNRKRNTAEINHAKSRFTPHLLLDNDRQGFMHDLRLDQKAAIFDGSNIYHFGHENGQDAQPLGALADQLRTEGYRVICFFDANIFHTLAEHGAFQKQTRHAVHLLQDIFGLEADEIYVVPAGTQADRYILESLKNLPISFAVTNDLFRDYAKDYADLMKDAQWRKGVAISKGEVRLT